MSASYDCIIVGSGAGGATFAQSFCTRGRRVLMLETGKSTFPPPFCLEKSIEGTDIFTAYGGGGAAALMNGNLIRSLQKELAQFGIVLENVLKELEDELHVAPIHESLLAPNGAIRILERCRQAGIGMRRMPKCIDHTRCVRCGNCSLGCQTGAKWTPLEFLKEAVSLRGLEIAYETTVEKVIVERGKAKG